MPIRVPLYGKVLVWLALNLLLGALLAYTFAAPHETGLNVLLTQSVRERTITLARSVAEQAAPLDSGARISLLQQLSAEDGVSWSLSGELGPRLPPQHREPFAGPPDAAASPNGPNGPPFRDDHGPPGGGPEHAPPFGPFSHGILQGAGVSLVRSAHPGGYDVIVEMAVDVGDGPPRQVKVTAHCDGAAALLRFLGTGGVLLLLAVLLLMTGLWWWPFVWNLSHALRDLRTATQQMSRGQLHTRVEVNRRDELGELGVAVNVMAERLESYLQGQRQFIADIAHEVTSPVARMQIGLALLEQRLGTEGAETLKDLHEDVEEMAGMLNELLLFSRSGLEAARTAPRAVPVAAAVSGIAHTECQDVPIHIDAPAELQVLVQPPLFQRAISNLLRNARSYGAQSDAAIEVTARADDGRVRIAVQDRGPGVPEQALAHLGEPFFRPERSRSRSTGGFGLGLAIVRRCVEACGGTVAFRNRVGGGFEVELDLPAALAQTTM